MRAATSISVFAFGLCLAFPACLLAPQPALAIIGAGVQASEDAPFVSADYQFLPGDFVYFTFEITGFRVSENENDVHSIALSYEVTPQDAAGKSLAAGVSGKIDTSLSPQDKNWTPKRRASFLLPSFLAAGTYHVRVTVKDALGKTQTTSDFPFHIGGTQIKPSPTITVENFRFLRKADDPKQLEVPAYSPGDHVFARFEMAGYKLGPKNMYDVAYGVTVLGPDGKPFIKQANAAELKSSSFYPAQFVPGTLNLITNGNTAHGEYIIILRAKDLLGNQTYELKKAFSIE